MRRIFLVDILNKTHADTDPDISRPAYRRPNSNSATMTATRAHRRQLHSRGQNFHVGGTAVIGSGIKVQNQASTFDGVEIRDYALFGPHLRVIDAKWGAHSSSGQESGWTGAVA